MGKTRDKSPKGARIQSAIQKNRMDWKKGIPFSKINKQDSFSNAQREPIFFPAVILA